MLQKWEVLLPLGEVAGLASKIGGTISGPGLALITSCNIRSSHDNCKPLACDATSAGMTSQADLMTIGHSCDHSSSSPML